MRVLIKNLAVEYTDKGNGPVMLLLHGWGNDLHSFDALVQSLISSWRVIRLDLPGFGGSEAPKETWGVGEYSQFVRAFIERLGISAYLLVGHSFGGRIAIKGIADGLLRAKKLVLIGSAGLAKRKTLRNRLFKTIAKVGKTALSPFPAYLRDRLRRKLYAYAGSEDYLAAGPLQATFLKVMGEDLSHAAKRVYLPTLLIWGEFDTATPLSDGKHLHTLISGSQFEIVKSATHFVYQEKTAEVAQAIQRFVS